VDGKTFDKRTPDWVKVDPAAPWPRGGKPVDWIVLNAAVNSTAHLEEKEGNQLVTVGNSTEGALLHWLFENGVLYQKLRLQYPPVYQVHFSSERKRMTTVIEYGGRPTTLVKGAPGVVIDLCTHYLTEAGESKPWTPEARDAVRAGLKAAAGQAMRTLGFAFATLPAGTPADADGLQARKDDLEKDLVFAGFVAIRDPLRHDVKEAVTRCRDAGIDVKMITGDNIETARAIAAEIGLLDTPDAAVLTHDEFTALSDDQLKEVMPRLRVLARARPLDKLRIVHILQAQNQVVAMTGDGTNDAPALRRADVGLAMGISGTEVAKEASKIVLLDDAFSTIVKAVEWGRSLYENIQRFIQFQLTINVSALTIAFLGPFLGIKPPFTVLDAAVDQRDHGHVRVDRAVLRAAARGADEDETEAPRREHRHQVNADDDLLHGGVLRGGDDGAAGGDEVRRLVRGRQRPESRRVGIRGVERAAGDVLLHHLRAVPGVEPDQLPLAHAGP